MRKAVLGILIGLLLISCVSAIRINEVELNPEGTDAGNEWIELFSSEEIDLTGWTLKYATGISNDGNVIVGYGTNPDGLYEAWIVTDLDKGVVPEPSSFIVWSLIAISFAGTGWWRHRKRLRT